MILFFCFLIIMIFLSESAFAYWPFDAKKLAEVKDWDDVRGNDLQSIEPVEIPLRTLTFNLDTIWPESISRQAEEKLHYSKNPGLRIRELHKQGVTGAGVNLAIIDQPLCTDHPEFIGKIAMYKDFGCESDTSMHGPAVTSLLVGESVGTAPGAKVFYGAAPSWKADSSYYARALDWIIDENRSLPDRSKIRLVSVSVAPSGQGSPFTKNNGMWDISREKAEKAGILVLDCTSDHSIVGPCYFDPVAPDNIAKCDPGWPGNERLLNRLILAPCSYRTVAEEYREGEFSYQYTGRGGLSWGIPYVAGVLALGWQINPILTKDEAVALLLQSSYKKSGYNFIDPYEFVRVVRATV